jgi:hypothetical protein
MTLPHGSPKSVRQRLISRLRKNSGRDRKTYPFDKLPRQAGAGRAGSQGLKSLRENPHCVVPSGLDLREILPGTPVPGYRLSRPFRD